MAQLFKRPTLDFSSDHDLTVHGFEPHVGLYVDSSKPAWDSLSAPNPTYTVNKQTNKQTFKKMVS